MSAQITKLFIQIFFLFTPFFALSMFLTLTEGMSRRKQLLLIMRTALSIIIICYTLVFGGNVIFDLFGITVNAFRIGAGAILFLSAVDLVRGKAAASKSTEEEDIAVVPLSIPVIVGPATIGTLMVMGSGFSNFKSMIPLTAAIPIAVFALSMILLISPWLMKLLGRKGLTILSRLTGLILAALSAEMIFAGIKGFLF